MQIEIKIEGYWVLLDITHLFLVEVKPKLVGMCELDINYKFPGDPQLVPLSIEHQFTIEQANKIIDDIKKLKNPPKPEPERVSRWQQFIASTTGRAKQ